MKTCNFTNGFAPILKATEGSELLDIEGWEDEAGNKVPKVAVTYNEQGDVVKRTEYVTLIFADNCHFNLTLKAAEFLTTSEFNGEPNDSFVPEGIIIGKRYSCHRDENGRPVVKCVK